MKNIFFKNPLIFIFAFLAMLIFYESFWTPTSYAGRIFMMVAAAVLMVVSIVEFGRARAKR